MRRKKTSRTKRRGMSRWQSALLIVLVLAVAALTASGIQYYYRPLKLSESESTEPADSRPEPTGMPEQEIAYVLEILGPDTIVVRCGGSEETIRLCDIKPVAGASSRAAKYLHDLLEGHQVRLERGLGATRDHVGRRRFFVLLSGRNVNVELVRRGFAEYQPESESRFGPDFHDAERDSGSLKGTT